MTEPTSVRLDVSRVGPQMIYKVTALDAAGNELDHVGWIVAQVANENPLAMEEAHECVRSTAAVTARGAG